MSKNGAIWELENSAFRTNIFHYRTYTWATFDSLCKNSMNSDVDIKLKRLNKLPNRFYRLFIQVFPFLLNQVRFKLEVIK